MNAALAYNDEVLSIPPGQDELPCEDGEPMETPKHRDQMWFLIGVLQILFADRPDIYIGGNMALYYSELQARKNDFRAPDFFVVTDAVLDRERKSWVVWQENGRVPDVVIELLSASTEHEDRGRKMQIYAGLRVSEYYLYDPHSELLEGYRLDNRAYVPMVRRADGDYECRILQLRLGVAEGLFLSRRDRWLRWKTLSGEPLPTGDELAELAQAYAAAAQVQAEAAQVRADTATAQLAAVEARAERLAARMRELGIDPEV